MHLTGGPELKVFNKCFKYVESAFYTTFDKLFSPSRDTPIRLIFKGVLIVFHSFLKAYYYGFNFFLDKIRKKTVGSEKQKNHCTSGVVMKT